MPFAGQEVGPYILQKKIGAGGFGEVWLAVKQSKFVTKQFAVKLPLKEQVDTDAIRQEAQLWEQASGHPNVLPIIDADDYDGQIAIVSEYAPDGSLADLLKRQGRIPCEKAVELIDGVLAGLEFLHSRRIIHRDLKPDNILLQGATPRLADFGISRVLRATMTSHSVNLAGTPFYMAPEAFDKKRNPQTDIWAAGVILYEMLAGRRPFAETNLIELVGAIATKEPAPLPADVPAWLNDVVSQALAKIPAHRYQTASEMRQSIRQLANLSAPQPVLESTVIDGDDLPTQPPAPRPNAGWKVGAFTLSALLLSGIGGAIYFNQPNGANAQNTNSQPNTATVANNSQPQNENANTVPVNSNNDAANPTATPYPSTPIATPSPTPDKNQLQQVANRYLAGVVKANGHSEYKETRKIVYGDIDNDGDEDAVVGFVLLVPELGMSGYEISIAVFRNNYGKFEGVTDGKVGGRYWRGFKLVAVANGSILGVVNVCGDRGACNDGETPDIQKQISIAFKNDKLIIPQKPGA